MAKTMTPADLDALDRLEQKVRLLVAEVGRLRADQTRMADENRRLATELASATERLSVAEDGAAESAALRRERDDVRSRVAGILEQLEGLEI